MSSLLRKSAAKQDARAALAISMALMFVSFVSSSANAKEARAQVAEGRTFALAVCSACHVVAKDQAQQPILLQPGPNFVDIAQRPGLTEEGLRKFLSTHAETMGRTGRMPNPDLVDYQIDKIVAYIMSLRNK